MEDILHCLTGIVSDDENVLACLQIYYLLASIHITLLASKTAMFFFHT